MNAKIVVHIIPSLNKGGAERFVVDLCNQLIQNIEKIYLISLYDNLLDTTFISVLHPKVQYIQLGKKPGFQVNIFFKLYRCLKKIRPDVVHTHINSFEYALLYRLECKSGIFVHTIHSKAEEECPLKPIKWIRRYFYQRNTVPITISVDGQKTYRSYYRLSNDVLIDNGCPEVKPTVKYAALKNELKNQADFLLVHIGRIIKIKNQALLIQAVQLFNKRSYKKIKLLIIGGIRDAQLFSELRTLCNADECIDFLGNVDNVGDYLLLANAFCLSSVHEGMPISLIEALSAGCIPICTPVGGIPEVVQNDKTGFLSADMSLEAYHDAIHQCLYAINQKEIKESCKDLFKKKYNISLCAQHYIDVYNERMQRIKKCSL